jgi:hypothetical protein
MFHIDWFDGELYCLAEVGPAPHPEDFVLSVPSLNQWDDFSQGVEINFEDGRFLVFAELGEQRGGYPTYYPTKMEKLNKQCDWSNFYDR